MVADEGGDDVSVLLGGGDGTFGTPSTFPMGAVPSSVAIADVNGDGKPDLVGANEGESDVVVLLQQSAAMFTPPLTFPGAFGFAALAIADVNGDGKLDIVVPNSAMHAVAVLLGNGAGSFSAATFDPVGTAPGAAPNSVAVADLDGDGKLDLAVSNGGSVSVLLGNGDGTFKPPIAYPTGSDLLSIAIKDLDGDGKLDVAAAGRTTGGGEVSVLRGNGDGTLRAPVSYRVGTAPSWLAIGDFNRDGRLDIAVANLDDNTVSILLGACGTAGGH